MANAQTIDSVPHHYIGDHVVTPSTIMEMSDNSILGGCLMVDFDNGIVPFGNTLHKLSRKPMTISDTVFLSWLPNEAVPWQLTFRNPFGDDNVLVEMFNELESDAFYLKIRYFDNNLHFDDPDGTVVLLSDQLAQGGMESGMVLTPQGDLVVAYSNFDEENTCFAQIGLDGTVKQSKKYSSETILVNHQRYGPKVFSESPLQYCYWGIRDEDGNEFLHCYVLDSTFNILESYTIPSRYHPLHFLVHLSFGRYEKMLGLDDGDFLIASRNWETSSFTQDVGSIVLKFDKNFNLKAHHKFPITPYLEYCHGNTPIGLEKSNDGNIYYAHSSQEPNYYGQWYGQVVVTKMDCDLNTIWQRFCLEPMGYAREYGIMTVLDDNSVAIIGNNVNSSNYMNSSEIFYLIVNDDYDSIAEQQGVIIRPYAYWPNPAQDELHLQFSPDVTPQQIELYDLQGRLVRTQRSGLESLGMEGLAAGAYTMRVTLEGGKTFTDKVVKE